MKTILYLLILTLLLYAGYQVLNSGINTIKQDQSKQENILLNLDTENK
jgi:hypothetical protein